MTRPEINVTPLIDVLLVLLIIFMVVTPIRPSSFSARIPGEPTRDPRVDVEPDTLIVAVSLRSEVLLNEEVVNATIDEMTPLTERLKIIFAERSAQLNEQRTVFIKAPRTISYGDVAKVIDAVKAAGTDPVSLQIDELE
jgi:biopolymer transport protein ExbD